MREPPPVTPPEDLPTAPPPRRVRHQWFPVVVLVAAAVAIGLILRSDQTRDVRIVTSLLTGFACAVLCVLWLALFVCRRWWSRLLVLSLPFAAVVLLFSSVQLDFDGDMAVIGWRLRWVARADESLEAPDVSTRKTSWRTTEFDYPGFLGPHHNAVIDNVVLDTDWKSSPPREIWRVAVGAGWSGFAVVGDYAVTQEQRGEYEMVVCRRLADGEIVWTCRDKVRFDPGGLDRGSLGDVGPRATPAIHDGMVFSHGATGILNCIDARTGQLHWSHDTIREHDGQVVTWGKSGSPIIVDDNVVVSVGGPRGQSLVAYEIRTGNVAWSSGDRQSSYATPVLTTLCGVRQIVCVNEDFVTAHRAENGEILWEHVWPGKSEAHASCPNPIPVDDRRVLLCKGYGIPSELVEVTQSSDERFSTKRQWRKPVMRTKMTNAVISAGHVYGLDGGVLSCVELETGRKKWKKGRYGHGQVLLVGDVLLVTTELTGEVVLIAASPQQPEVLARHKVLTTRGKMWNYPALAGKFLLVRNAEEAACYELPLGHES